jgi:hypothetical protein
LIFGGGGMVRVSVVRSIGRKDRSLDMKKFNSIAEIDATLERDIQRAHAWHAQRVTAFQNRLLPKKRKPRLSSESIKRMRTIYDLRQSGLGFREIGKRFGFSYQRAFQIHGEYLRRKARIARNAFFEKHSATHTD